MFNPGGTNVSHISVEDDPVDIEVDEVHNIAYVANSGSNSVSVIDTNTMEVSKNIPVGDGPVDIEVDEDENLAYVANQLSDTVSIIDGRSQKVLAGVSFDVNPFQGGRIVCNNISVSTNQYTYIDFRTGCVAQPENGFRFSNWIENFGGDSIRIINASTPSDSPFSWFMSTLGMEPEYPSANLTVTKFGNFSANFEKLPPPIPSEYLIPLYVVIASSIVGWSIPSIVGWVKAKRMGRTSNTFHKRIGSLYDDGKLDYNDIESLDKLRSHLSDIFTKGMLTDEHYQNLKSELSVLYEEIHRKRIDSLNGPAIRHDSKDDKLLSRIKNDIDDAFAKGKVSDQHYNLLNKKIDHFVSTSNNSNINR